MNRNRYLKLGAVVAVLLLAAALVVAWRSVAAQQGDDPATGPGGWSGPVSEAAAAPQAPVPGGPGFYMQSAVAFRPWSATTNWAYFGAELFNPGTGLGFNEASLSLPNGATITKLVAYYYDECVSQDLSVNLWRCPSAGPCDQPMASVSTSGSAAAYRYGEDSSIDYSVVDQQSNSYVAEAVLGGGCGTSLRLVNVRIDYAYTVSLPMVIKD